MAPWGGGGGAGERFLRGGGGGEAFGCKEYLHIGDGEAGLINRYERGAGRALGEGHPPGSFAGAPVLDALVESGVSNQRQQKRQDKMFRLTLWLHLLIQTCASGGFVSSGVMGPKSTRKKNRHGSALNFGAKWSSRNTCEQARYWLEARREYRRERFRGFR